MVEIVKVKKDDKQILLNLLEKYQYEFSQYSLIDLNPLGLYGYDYLDCYFTEANRYPYFIKVNGQLAGFIMISDYPEVPEEGTDFCLSEFFVSHKYRKHGIGRIAFFDVLNKHRGQWQLKRHPKNIGSVYFWDKVINDYTKGQYKLVKAYPNPDVNYEDGTPADVFFFNNKDL
ncbi:MAG: GNAT family N-acetyltransferase [Candidatus Izemoplasmatales bacterium]